MQHEVFRTIVSTQRAKIPWEGRDYDRVLNNKNKLLSTYEGATGIKTGYTKAAGRCLVFGAERDGLEVIGVVLCCGDWFDEAARLLDLGFAKYESFTALSGGETVRRLPVVDGVEETVGIVAAGELAAPLPKGYLPALVLDLPEALPAGLAAGEEVGTARLVLEGKVLNTVPLVTGDTVGRRNYGYELERMLRLWAPQGEEMAQ
jgi:D-alanyl-D-alanine carboxypeptidase